jgi:predicted nucleic acid-binding protein
VYLDTSVVIGAMYRGSPNATACKAFCTQLASDGSHVYFSQVLRLDLARALRRLATKPDKIDIEERREYRLDDWGRNTLVRQRWIANGVRRFHAFLDQFEEAVELPLTTRLWRDSLDLMAIDALDSADAMHIATARSSGIPHIATTDRDFRKITFPQVHLIRDSAAFIED